MWIKSFRLTNYKSFEDSGEHTLARHMNVIVGQNNVGKTALLQAVAQRFDERPHRNSSQRRGATLSPRSKIELDFISTAEEISDAMMVGNPVRVILPQRWQADPLKFLQLPEVTFSAAYLGSSGCTRSRFPSNNITAPDSQYVAHTFAPNPERPNFDITQLTSP